MKCLFNFIVSKLLPFFVKRNLSITKKLESAQGQLFRIAAVEPETPTERNGEQVEMQLIKLQESARNEAIRNIQALSSMLKTHESSAIKIMVSGNRGDILRPIQAGFCEYFTKSDRIPCKIDEALYWETAREGR